MAMHTYTNSFHGSEARSRYSREELESMQNSEYLADRDEAKRAKAILDRLWKKLCGIEGCTCGNRYGER